MNNFINNTMQPFTVFMNDFMQGETIFEKPSTKLTYMYLYSLKNCVSVFPSHETIAIATCTSVATVKRTLNELVDLGLLEIESRPGKTSIYILNDYYQVIQNKVAQNDLAQNELPTQLKMSYLPSSKRATKTKTIKIKTKNKNSSSSSDSKKSIDSKLKEKYPDTPFDELKEQMLQDETLTIKTDKQYKSMLEYRLKNWNPKVPKKKKVARKEIVPVWFDQETNITVDPDEAEAKKVAMAEKLARFRA